MKKRKTIVSLLAMAAVLLLVFQNSLTASAEGNTYIVVSDEEGEWYWEEEEDDLTELEILQQRIKDGDLLVVSGRGGELHLNAHLANVTFLPGTYALVFTNGIDDCFMLAGSAGAISGSVKTAYVYDDAGVTFNSNVNTLNIIGTGAELFANVNVARDVAVATVIGEGVYGRIYEYYNITPGKLLIENGSPRMAEGTYSTTPSTAASQTTTAPETTAAPVQQSAADEYDDVPKTGESTTVYWLLGIAVVCLAGRYALRKAA